jgi:signal transduction histidine kinase
MPPTDDFHANDDLEVITRAIHDVRSPLTILSARAQLLARRIEHGRIDNPYSCLGSLESIRRAAEELEARLHDLEQIVCGCEAGRNVTKSPQDI